MGTSTEPVQVLSIERLDARTEADNSGLSKNMASSAFAARVSHIADRLGSFAQPLGTTVMPKGPFVVDGRGSNHWVVLKLEQDPNFKSAKLGIPPAARKRLRRIADGNVKFDNLLIAHEIPVSGALGDLQADQLTALIPPARGDEQTRELRDRIQRVLKRITGMMDRTLDQIGQPLLDPALIGVLSPSGQARPGEQVVLVLLAQWT